MLAEHSRLLLERSTFAGLQTVEAAATEELQMAFPDEIKEVSAVSMWRHYLFLVCFATTAAALSVRVVYLRRHRTGFFAGGRR